MNEFLAIQQATQRLIAQMDPVLNAPVMPTRKRMVVDMLSGICNISTEGYT